MPTLKFVINARGADKDVNTSTALEFVVDDAAEARAAGETCCKLVEAFSEGFNEAAK